MCWRWQGQNSTKVLSNTHYDRPNPSLGSAEIGRVQRRHVNLRIAGVDAVLTEVRQLLRRPEAIDIFQYESIGPNLPNDPEVLFPQPIARVVRVSASQL
jgi:hypothetical protein